MRHQTTLCTCLTLLLLSPSLAAQQSTRPPVAGAVKRAGPTLKMIKNPIIARDLPDPAIFFWKGARPGYYLIGTAGAPPPSQPVFALSYSTDLASWAPAGALFPPGRWPRWAVRDFWAPELHEVGGRLVVYYTARDRSGKLCIGAATAPAIQGPWTDLGRPLLRDPRTGVIDASYFRDRDGRHYLTWKLDGNDTRPPSPTPIYLQEVGPDGTTLKGTPRIIITNDLAWEGSLVEGPWLIQRGAHYYLFYSGNFYASAKYAVGVARATSLKGPWQKAPRPILRSNRTWAGPGHGSIVSKGGKDWYVYHAWQAARIGNPHPRMVLLDPIRWSRDGWPRIGSGTPSVGPVPSE